MSSNHGRERGQSYWSVYRHAQRQTDHDLENHLDHEPDELYSVVPEDSTVPMQDYYAFTDSVPEHETEETIDNSDATEGNCSDVEVDFWNSSDQHWMNTDSSDSSESDTGLGFTLEGDNDSSLADKLSEWSVEFNITLSAVNKLLKILKPHFSSLPHDARTLLKTPRQVAVQKCGNGEYVHCGLKNGLELVLRDCSLNDAHEIQLQFNVDGLPLFKSANTQLWPILCLVKLPKCVSPFVVGIYSGSVKPPVLFLTDIVSELKELIANGLPIDGKQIRIALHSFVCDAPARAFVKCTKMHSGYSSCEKCDQRGEWAGKVIFTSVAGNLRTDESFIAHSDEDHHLPHTSPLTELPLGMVTQFPLDPMHLLYLGVMRRLLVSWVRGPLTVRLSAGI